MHTMNEFMLKGLAPLVEAYQRMSAMSQQQLQEEQQLLSSHLAECTRESEDWMLTWMMMQAADLHLSPPRVPVQTLRELITVMGTHLEHGSCSRSEGEAPSTNPGKQEPAESIPWLL